MNIRNATLITLGALVVGSLSACGGNGPLVAANTTVAPTTSVPPTTAAAVDCGTLFAVGQQVTSDKPTCLIDGQLTAIVTGTYTCSNNQHVNYNDFGIWLDDGVVAAKPAAGGVTRTQLEAACGVVPTTTAAPTTTVPPTSPPTTPPPPPTPTTPVTNAPDPNRPSPVPGASADMAGWMNQISDEGFCDTWSSGADTLGATRFVTEVYVCDSHPLSLIRFTDDASMGTFLNVYLEYSAGEGIDRDGAELLLLAPSTVMMPLSESTGIDNLGVLVLQGILGGERLLIADLVD